MEYSEAPLYMKVKEYINSIIAVKGLHSGDALPTEAELEAVLKVSRTTVRTALAELRHEGVITQQRGKGTFVADTAVEEHLTLLKSFTEYAIQRGHKPTSLVLGKDLIIPNEFVKERLQISDGTVLKLTRLRLMDGQAIQINTSFLPQSVIAKISNWDEIDFSTASLYATMEEHGIILDYADEMLRVSEADEVLATLLNLKAGSPLFSISRTVYDEKGTPIEYVESHTRGEQHRAYSRMRRRI